MWVRWPLSRTFCLVCLFVTTRQWCLVGIHWNSQVLVLKQNIRQTHDKEQKQRKFIEKDTSKGGSNQT